MTSPLDRHTKIALSFSGGKDSLACVYLLKDRLDDITLYHNDTGDLLPEMRESVARVERFVPRFVRVNTNVSDWIARNGLPADLVPYTSHPVAEAVGESRQRLVPRYDCCYQNLMWPLFDRVRSDGCTLLIRGTKRCDLQRLPAQDGEIIDGVEIHYPLLDWSHEQVFAFLALNHVPLPRIYEFTVNSPECARCSAWWGERRAEYLKKYHPQLWRDYDDRLQIVINEIALPLAMLKREAGVE